MARMYDRPTLGPDGWIIDETPTPNPVYVEAQTDPLTGGITLSSGLVSAFAANGALDVRMFGAKCNGKAVYDATATNSATSTIASATLNLTSADVGKRCAIVPYVDSSLTTRHGTISSVTSATECVASLSGAPGTLTGATFIYGTDDLTAVSEALTAAKTGSVGGVFIPAGITVLSGQIIVPCGVTLFGIGNYATGGKAKDMRYAGSSLILAGYLASPFVVGGDINVSSPKGWSLSRLNIDCLNLALFAYSASGTGRTEHIDHCTFNRGINATVDTSATSRIHSCCIFGQNQGNVVHLSGDSSFLYNIVTGAGNGYYGIKLSNPDDVVILGNHIWKDGSLSSMLGGSIFVSFNTGNVVAGGVTIEGNKFDTAYGPHIYLKASAASTGRGVSIIGNQSMNNDAVTNGTGAFIELEIQSGCVLRGLNVHGNICRGSWYDPTKGQHSYFLNGSATAGNVYGSSFTGNIIDNVVSGGFNAFTPTYTAGNLYMVGTGTTATAF
jgi:hypothetical protein